MALTDPSPRRRQPVRLADVDLNLRVRAARRLLKEAKTAGEAQAILAAATRPSDTVYYIAA